MLVEMGFPEPRSRRALLMHNDNVGACLDWLERHSSNPDVDEELSVEEMEALRRQRNMFMPEPHLVSKLVEMGFSLGKVMLALRACDNDEQRAMCWLFEDVEQEHPRSDSEKTILSLASLLSRPAGAGAHPIALDRNLLSRLAQLAQSDLLEGESPPELDDPSLRELVLALHRAESQ